MFGRIRASPSPAEFLETEIPPSKLFKDNSLSIYGVQITRGSAYSFTANVSVDGCIESNFGAQFCNQTVESLSCSESGTDSSSTTDLPPAESYNGIPEYLVSCRSSVRDSCHGDNETRVFSLEVTGMAEQFIISAKSIRLNGTQSSNNTDKVGDIVLMWYARYGAIALASMHEYSSDINKGPLTIPLPKTGRWYVTIAPVNLIKEFDSVQNSSMRVCYSLAWQVAEFPLGKAGLNCTWDMYTLHLLEKLVTDSSFGQRFTQKDTLESFLLRQPDFVERITEIGLDNIGTSDGCKYSDENCPPLCLFDLLDPPRNVQYNEKKMFGVKLGEMKSALTTK